MMGLEQTALILFQEVIVMMKRLIAALLLAVLCASAALAEDKPRYEELGRWSYEDSGLIAVKRDGLWGFVNGEGEEVIPCEWQDCSSVRADKIAVCRDGKWGAIDLEGNILVEPAWQELSVWSDGSYSVRHNGTAGLLNAQGEVVVPCGEYTYVGYDIDGMLLVCKDELWGRLDLEGNVVIPCQYTHGLEYFYDDLAVAHGSENLGSHYCYIDRTGAQVFGQEYAFAWDFRNGAALVQFLDGGWNFINTRGEELFEMRFADGDYLSDGMYMVQDGNGKYGYVDAHGKLVIEPVYDRAQSFGGGLARVEKDGERFFIDKTGTRVLDYDPAWGRMGRFENGYALVNDGEGLYGVIDETGKYIVPCEWEWVDTSFNWYDFIRVEKEGKVGFLNTKGESVTGEMYEKDSVSYTCDREHLFLLRDGELSIWRSDGRKIY